MNPESVVTLLMEALREIEKHSAGDCDHEDIETCSRAILEITREAIRKGEVA